MSTEDRGRDPTPGQHPDPGLARLNSLTDARAGAYLRACCASPVWIDRVVGARPFADRAAFLVHADVVLANLDWAEVRRAIDAHPRIGARPVDGGTEATWSRREQAGVATATDAVKVALAEVNAAYERRFGFVFLIFASGRTEVEILAAARERLGHDEGAERAVVRGELARIVGLRLVRLLDESPLDEEAVDA